MENSLTISGGKFNIAQREISIVINDTNGIPIGKFYIKDDKLDFTGNLTEAGLKFVDFVKTTFNDRFQPKPPRP